MSAAVGGRVHEVARLVCVSYTRENPAPQADEHKATYARGPDAEGTELLKSHKRGQHGNDGKVHHAPDKQQQQECPAASEAVTP